jgi:hypothetical protein
MVLPVISVSKPSMIDCEPLAHCNLQVTYAVRPEIDILIVSRNALIESIPSV